MWCILAVQFIMTLAEMWNSSQIRRYAKEFIDPDNGDVVTDAIVDIDSITIWLKRGDLLHEVETINYRDYSIMRRVRDDISIPIFYIYKGYVELVDFPKNPQIDEKEFYKIERL